MQNQNTLLAVDSNFLMDLARPEEMAFDALDVIRSRARGARIVVTTRVVDELVEKWKNDPDAKTREIARRALLLMRQERDLVPVDLTDLQATYAESIADELREREVIKWEERNDAIILAEAAVLGCVMLVSSDNHLLVAKPEHVREVLRQRGVSEVVIRSPRDIVREFGGRKR